MIVRFLHDFQLLVNVRFTGFHNAHASLRPGNASCIGTSRRRVSRKAMRTCRAYLNRSSNASASPFVYWISKSSFARDFWTAVGIDCADNATDGRLILSGGQYCTEFLHEIDKKLIRNLRVNLGLKSRPPPADYRFTGQATQSPCLFSYISRPIPRFVYFFFTFFPKLVFFTFLDAPQQRPSPSTTIFRNGTGQTFLLLGE